MATVLWTPPSYNTAPLRVRRNPNASVYEPLPGDNWGFDDMITPNGQTTLNGVADDALAQLEAAGPRGAAVLGAAAGLLFSGWKAGLFGGFLGYYSGKYLVTLASKALTVVTAANKVASVVTPSTPTPAAP